MIAQANNSLSFQLRKELFLYQKILFSFIRQKGIILMTIIFPVIFLSVGWFTGNDIQLTFTINNDILIAKTREISVISLSLVSVSFLAIFISFYLFLTTKQMDFRLKRNGYSNFQIFRSKLFSIGFLLIPSSIITFGLGILLVKVNDITLVLVAFILEIFIYALIGVIISFLLQNRLQATYTALILVVIDLGFLESPLWSEVYNKSFMVLLPGYYPSKLLLEASFSLSSVPLESIGFSLLYIIGLLIIIIIISKFKRN